MSIYSDKLAHAQVCSYPSTGLQDGWKVTKVFCTFKVAIHAKTYAYIMF